MTAMSASSVSSQDQKTVVIGAWLLSSIALDFSTRFLTIDMKFNGLLVLSAVQTFVLLVISQAVNLLVSITSDGRPMHIQSSSKIFELTIPLVSLLGSLPLLTHATLTVLPAWHQIWVVTSLPIVTAVASRLLRQQRASKKVLLLISSMCLAVAATMLHGKHLTSWQDHTNNESDIQVSPHVNLSMSTLFWIGLAGGILGIVTQAGTGVLSQRALHEPNDIPVRILVAYYAPGALALSLFSAATQGSAGFASLKSLPAEAVAANALIACVKLYSFWSMIKLTSATTVALASMLQAGFTELLAGVVFNVPIKILPALSFFFAFSLFAKYFEHEYASNKVERSHERTATEGEEMNEQGISEQSASTHKPQVETVNTNLFILLAAIVIAVLVIASMATPEKHRYKPWDNSIKAYNDTRVATIIETRNLPHLIPLLLQFLTVLPDNWPMLVWGSRENIEVLKQSPAIVRALSSGRLNITLFPDEFDIQSQEYISRFLTKPWFWENLPAEWILFFQSDSMLCSKSPDSIENWVGFDWVGAPWEDRPDAQGGNGGLSMRKRSSLIKLTTDPDVRREDETEPEDVWFSQNLGRLPDVKWPTRHQGRFSVENYWDSMGEWAWKPLGVHSGGTVPPDWKNKDVMKRLSDWCPELKIFYDPLEHLT